MDLSHDGKYYQQIGNFDTKGVKEHTKGKKIKTLRDLSDLLVFFVLKQMEFVDDDLSSHEELMLEANQQEDFF